MAYAIGSAIAESGGIPTGEDLEELTRYPDNDDDDRGIWSYPSPVQTTVRESQWSWTSYRGTYALGASFPLPGEETLADAQRVQGAVHRMIQEVNRIPARLCADGKIDGFKAQRATYANPDPEEIQVVVMVEVFYTVSDNPDPEEEHDE